MPKFLHQIKKLWRSCVLSSYAVIVVVNTIAKSSPGEYHFPGGSPVPLPLEQCQLGRQDCGRGELHNATTLCILPVVVGSDHSRKKSLIPYTSVDPFISFGACILLSRRWPSLFHFESCRSFYSNFRSTAYSHIAENSTRTFFCNPSESTTSGAP